MCTVGTYLLMSLFVFVAGESVTSTRAQKIVVACCGVDQTPTPTPTPAPSPTPSRGRGHISRTYGGSHFTGPGCDPMRQEETNLSGNYSGNVSFPDGGLVGAATLAINGNEFSLISGKKKFAGQIVTVTTCGYAAVAMRFIENSEVTATAAPSPPMSISLRATKMGNRLRLVSVPKETNQFAFTSAGWKEGTWWHKLWRHGKPRRI